VDAKPGGEPAGSPPDGSAAPPAAAAPTPSEPATGPPATPGQPPAGGAKPGAGAVTATFPAPGVKSGGASTPVPDPPATPGPPPYGAARGRAPTLDLPGEARATTSGTIVLGGAAAAEGRTTGPTPRIGGPAPAGARPPGPGAKDDGQVPDEPGGRHFRSGATGQAPAADEADRRRLPSFTLPSWNLVAVAAPIAVVLLLLAGWAVDTAALSGQVMRNVEVAGRPVGGLGEASLPEVMTGIGEELAARKVRVEAGERVYETTAGELGLSLDAEATSEAALDAGRSDSLLTRPLSWIASFFSPREVDMRYSVSQSQVEAKMFELQGADLTAAQPPTIQLTEAGFAAVPGTPGRGIDTGDVADQLPAAAAAAPEGTIVVRTDTVPVLPPYTDEDAEALADRANQLTANGIALTAGDVTAQVDTPTLRSWIGPTTANGNFDLAINPDAVNAALPGLFADMSSEPVEASFDLQNGTPVVVPSRPGVTCCGANSAELVWQGVLDGQSPVALEVQVTEPEFTTEEAQDLGIVGPVGGSNAWRNGAPSTAGPGFTTYYTAGEPRVTNIHRIADMVRGAVILPGDTFSVNQHVGPRTTAKGFVEAGAIRDGIHVPEVGGGVSQFATTTFNAAYFAGLDIPTYQAHTESFTRYPPGREATMGHPNPDLRIRNNTPYGILIWTSYTSSSVTVTLYSTPYATGEQTGISTSMNGNCQVVTTTRTRTFPDGHTENDTFRAQYRPGEGQFC
jgi:vancomycin resistance protein YoaR